MVINFSVFGGNQKCLIHCVGLHKRLATMNSKTIDEVALEVINILVTLSKEGPH